MPRKARIDAPGAVHHIIARGIERGFIFHDDLDRDDFIRRLSDLVSESRTVCYAWALMPNHFHLLLKTGDVPIATIMRRLMTGYAVRFNRRHGRCGHLFQNRYKSILCQQDVYLKELIRYIHLNPLRAGLVIDAAALDDYRFAGHCYIVGKIQNDWQAVGDVLALFGDKISSARQRYRQYLVKGVGLGRRPELIGGGLIRSAGGWAAVQSMRKAGHFQKSDERILGESDFVKTVLSDAREASFGRYRLAAAGIRFEHLTAAVSQLLSVQPQELSGPSKERTIVKARALLCCWAVRELGLSMTDVAHHLNIAVATVSVAVRNGMRIVREEGLVLAEILNMEI